MQAPRTRGPRRPPTISDVARHAGVSVATASRALNGKDVVNPKTRDRILVVMEELGFSPSPAARRLSLGKTLTVKELAYWMITKSSNLATNLLVDVIGIQTIQHALDELDIDVRRKFLGRGRKRFEAEHRGLRLGLRIVDDLP